MSANNKQPTGLANPWLQVAVSTVSVAISELFLKRGANATVQVSQVWAWTGLTTLSSPLVWLGMIFTIVSFVTWLYAIKHLPLSVAFPASQAVHVLIPLSSWLVLGERINTLRWCGIALVLGGLALVVRPVAELEEKL
ncbi:MAG: DMT family transporter [Verrucomicrobiota bacterium]|nr:DMT family transporter [Verrucomicrobiota bacterium]